MTVYPSTAPNDGGPQDHGSAGVRGNERLTAWTGTVLLVMLAAQGLTILDIHWYLKYHMTIGLALFVPVAVKLCSTTYRFAKYYRHDPAYRTAGPPRPVMRIIAPPMVFLTLWILITGAAVMVAGDHRHQVEFLHKAPFYPWLALRGLHVLVYVWRVPKLALADLRERTPDAVRRVIAFVATGVTSFIALGIAWLIVKAWMAG